MPEEEGVDGTMGKGEGLVHSQFKPSTPQCLGVGGF